jgi:hypothetical protein
MREKITPLVCVKIRVKTFAHEPKRNLRLKCMALSACMALIKDFLPAEGMLGSVCQWLATGFAAVCRRGWLRDLPSSQCLQSTQFDPTRKATGNFKVALRRTLGI